MKDLKDQVLFVNINTDKRKHKRIMELIGMKDFQLPTMRIMKFEGDVTRSSSKSKKGHETNVTDSVPTKFQNPKEILKNEPSQGAMRKENTKKSRIS